MVETKSAANDFEKEIHNCFFLLFDNATGARINTPENLVGSDVTTRPTLLVKLDKVNATSVTACFIANVPSDFVSNIIGLDRPNTVEDTEANNQKYLNSAVLSGITYGTGNNFGKPYIDLDGATGSNSPVACIPMLGTQSITLPATNLCIQVPMRRLFAKVSVNLSMNIAFANTIDEAVNTYTYFQLNNYQVNNLPKKVRLTEKFITVEAEDPDDEPIIKPAQSDWIDEPDDFSHSIGSGTINSRIYNQTSTQTPKVINFEFYAPEYYLEPVGSITNAQTHKPDNYPDGTNPINVTLSGIYSQYSLNSKTLVYTVYLGEDEISSFSLARNTHYTNNLVISGTTKHKNDQANLDLRVSTTVINNPVAIHGKSANCYVINRAQKYEFPAYKGAYNDLNNAVVCTGGNAVRVIANEAQFESDWTDVTNINIDSLTYDAETNMISFQVRKPVDVDMVPNGNIVIALVNDDGDTDLTDDPIIWSWQFWFMSDYGNLDAAGWARITNQTYPSTAIMMDRNLGSYSTSSTLAEGIGPYYRYGRKEPFINGGYKGGGTLYNESGDPLTPDWSGDTKSPTDPCPPGYRVPSVNVWSEPTGSYPSHAKLPVVGWLTGGVLEVYEDVYYPYSGYRYSDTKDPNITSTGTKYFEVVDQFTGSLGLTASFRNVKFNAGVTLDTGYLLSKNQDTKNNPYLLTYGYYVASISDLVNNFELISCDYKPAFSSWKNNQTSVGNYMGALKAGLSVFSGTRKGADFGTEDVGSRDFGYQVRCVWEESPIK